MISKARADDFPGRFREIVSDPLNLLILRVPQAGQVEDDLVVLHNGLKVPLSGPGAYYGEFSAILVINRGVHEPLEEFAFQEVLKHLPPVPVMLELGAYWGHYSMWLKQAHPNASCYLVEPDQDRLQAGRDNFQRNGFSGEFIQAFVGNGQFEVDRFIKESGLSHLSILHADIQGHELDMLQNCEDSIRNQIIDYLFISTHSQKLHNDCLAYISRFSYSIEISSDFDKETTAFDGFIFASNPRKGRIFRDFQHIGREAITISRPEALTTYLAKTGENS